MRKPPLRERIFCTDSEQASYNWKNTIVRIHQKPELSWVSLSEQMQELKLRSPEITKQ